MSKYYYNEKFFEIINSEEKAYWLGFLYADGYIQEIRRRNKIKAMQLSIGLAKKDESHLYKFLHSIDSNVLVSDKKVKIKNKEYLSSIIKVSNTKMCRDLIKLGCAPRKSLTLKFPTQNQVPFEYINHFIRGYFDGDGSISYSNKQIVLNFVSGSSKFLLEISSIFNSIGCKNANLVGSNENYKYIQYNTLNDLTLLFRYLYSSNSNIFLNRKKEKLIYIIDNFKELKDIINKQRRDKYDRDKQNI